MTPYSIYELLKLHAHKSPNAVAIEAPERDAITYGRLFSQVESTVETLNYLGIVRNDVVAIVLPNGPEMATAFLGVACAATCAPLNPAYPQQEFEYYLSDLQAKALLVLDESCSPAVDAAQLMNIPIIRLHRGHEETSLFFTLEGEAQQGSHPMSANTGPAAGDDVALVLHTSGTTARPKIVPLSHANLCVSAANIRQALRLVADDRCLNVMPLFHIHGLMAALFATLYAGGSIVCTPGFYAPRFFEWLDAFHPTWYTAVPTMHQAILARADDNRSILARTRLRFVRSSSSSLPPTLMRGLEETLSAPVIEAYGMTEASHQMASNPLPPDIRKPGSVGMAAGPELAIMAVDGHALLPANTRGEIVIRGESVTRGYVNNLAANAMSFVNGWFRTGDQGIMDGDGYLFVTGRLKEIINRGGEKISPREVDEILLSHPDVFQAVTFAMPDAQLGEDVAAAVTLRPAGSATEVELRRFVAQRLAHFKTPRLIVILDEIPKGPTGKLQRIGLAEKLGIAGAKAAPPDSVEFVAPRSETEQFLAELWQEVLKVDAVGVYHQFLQLGGDSITATQLVARVNQALEIEISILDFFEMPTVTQQAALIEQMVANDLREI